MNGPVRIGGMAPPVFGRPWLLKDEVLPGFGIDPVEYGCLDAPMYMPAGVCEISEGEYALIPVQQVTWRSRK